MRRVKANFRDGAVLGTEMTRRTITYATRQVGLLQSIQRP